MKLASALLGCCLAVTTFGCSAASDEAPYVGEPTRASVEEARNAGGWDFYYPKFDCGSNVVANSVRRNHARHVYAFQGTAGQSTTFALDSSWADRLGAILFVTDAQGNITDWDYAYDDADVEVSTKFDRTDTYFVWITPIYPQAVRGRAAYSVTAHCDDLGCGSDLDCAADEACVQVQCITTPCPALCVAQPTCAELVTNDDRVYAKNFAAGDYAAAQDFVASFPATMSGINKGTCQELNTKPCNDDAPVCGQPAWADYPKDFASLCDFEHLVRGQAGETGEARGAFEDGMCRAEAPACDFDADPSKRYVGRSLEECMRIRFACDGDSAFFSDACGCGCQTVN